MSIISKYTDNYCDDLNCECEEGGIPTHEPHAVVPLTMLHYLAHRRINLVFIPDGRVWIGEDYEFDDLAKQLEAEAEARNVRAEQAQKRYDEERLRKAEAAAPKQAEPRKSLSFVEEDPLRPMTVQEIENVMKAIKETGNNA